MGLYIFIKGWESQILAGVRIQMGTQFKTLPPLYLYIIYMYAICYYYMLYMLFAYLDIDIWIPDIEYWILTYEI